MSERSETLFTAGDQVVVVGERTWAQRDAEGRKRAIDLDHETPRKRGRAAAVALEERVVGARSVCTAAVDMRVRELIKPAFEQWVAEKIEEAALKQRGPRPVRRRRRSTRP